MEISFFDFDGTITNKDSLPDFIIYAIGDFSYYKGLLILSPMLLAYKLKIIPNHIAKQKLISYFFKGWDIRDFQKITKSYTKEKIIEIVRPKAIERIKWHQEKGHKIVVVSASMEGWLKVWCKSYKLELIGTKLEVINNKITGKFATENCYGIEKVNRIKENYILEDYDIIYAYGDSYGDKEMLSIADKKYYKYFD
jgi:HAD superfamily hydrolase (TIGR01490 family)